MKFRPILVQSHRAARAVSLPCAARRSWRRTKRRRWSRHSKKISWRFAILFFSKNNSRYSIDRKNNANVLHYLWNIFETKRANCVASWFSVFRTTCWTAECLSLPDYIALLFLILGNIFPVCTCWKEECPVSTGSCSAVAPSWSHRTPPVPSASCSRTTSKRIHRKIIFHSTRCWPLPNARGDIERNFGPNKLIK